MIWGGIVGALGFAAWLFIFHAVSYSQSLALTSLHVYGAEADVTPDLEAAAYKALEGSYFGLLSKANSFIYPASSVAAAVQAASSRIDTVKVSPDGMHGLAISVIEKTPSAIVCSGLPDFDADGALMDDAASRGDCYFADASGKLFKEIPPAVPSSYSVFYAPAISDDPIGRYATSTREFQALQSFVNSLRAAHIIPEGILVKPGGEYELYARNSRAGKGGTATSSTAIIYFNDSGSFVTELSNLSAFWNKMAPANFEYIDVRYGSNVFYRLIQ